eukprot:6048050-Pyramimonas_sp.AAC.1
MPAYTTTPVCTTAPVYTAVSVHTTGAACTTTHGKHLRHSASVHLQAPAGAQIWKIAGNANIS